MALVTCPECGGAVSDQAPMCPHCGHPLEGGLPALWRWEYRSKTEYLGLPLVHIVYGPAWDPRTGRPRVAKGIVAVGPVAVGFVAFGGMSLGVLALGGMALGVVALGGLSVGVGLALGGLAIGTVAIGGGAVGYYALGGGAVGAHPLSPAHRDPEAVEFFKRLLGDWVERAGGPPTAPPPTPPSR